jgi:hypothetical protein
MQEDGAGARVRAAEARRAGPAQATTSDDPGVVHTLVALFSGRTAVVTVSICYLWFAASMSYYAISYNSGNLSPDPYANWLYTSALLPFSTYGGVRIIDTMGRTRGSSLCYGLCFLCIGIGVVAPASATLMSMVGNFFANAVFNAVYMQVPELYPTRYRNAVLGMASASARIGSMSASYIPYALGGAATLSIVTVCCFVATIVSLVGVPETLGRPMPESLPLSSLSGCRKPTDGGKLSPGLTDSDSAMGIDAQVVPAGAL